MAYPGSGSIAIGQNATSTGSYSIAIGYSAGRVDDKMLQKRLARKRLLETLKKL